MILRTVQSAGIAILLSAGLLATVVLAQQKRKPAADPAAPPAGVPRVVAPNKRAPSPPPRKQADPADLEQRSQAILEKLEEPVAMLFANETPLEDVLKYIKAATQGPNDAGIPIYVEPTGLEEAKQTMQSTVKLDMRGVPLKTTLRLVLRPLGLSYIVKDGLLTIDSRSAITETRVEAMEHKLDRILKTLERLDQKR